MNTHTSVITAVSFSQTPSLAASELRQQLEGRPLEFVLFFCSAEYDLEQLGQALSQVFAETPLAGCTTAGEISSQGYGQGCITAIGFVEGQFAVSGVGIQKLDNFSFTEAQSLVDQLISDCRAKEVAPIKGNSFALTLFDGLSIQEETVLAALNAALGSIPNFGGSAGDDVHLANTHVFFDGRFHNDAAMVLMFNTDCKFEVFSTHHMLSLSEKLVVTAANPDERRVYELNAEPAAIEYARAVGVELDALNHEVFALHPIAVKLGDAFYVRSIQQVNDDLSLTFYCAVENGIVLTVMEPGPMVPNLEAELARIKRVMGEPQLIIGCDCFLRRLEIELLGIKPEVSALLQANNVIGFNTYGEQMEGMHINQTFTGVAIGRCSDA
ncbi:MAG: nitric oxide-sensing protein NosP [Pontibacterium sp.]